MSRTNRRHSVVSVMGVAVLSLLLVTPALAQSNTTVVVAGGTFTMSTPEVGNFAGVTIDGEAKQTNATLAAFSVGDLRGTGAGWRVTAQATQFTNANVSRKLPSGSLQMSAPTVSAQGTQSPVPIVTSGPYTIDAGSPAEIAGAAFQTGMGTYDFGATTLTLSVPADVHADTYTSTVTLTVAAGP
jgi:formylglycine-generating enzyme required for sulfatase activity